MRARAAAAARLLVASGMAMALGTSAAPAPGTTGVATPGSIAAATPGSIGAARSGTLGAATPGTVAATTSGTVEPGAVGAVYAAGPDPALEARVAQLAEQLRCPVCQNQTLADSQAPLAVDLRQRIREQLASGASEAAVIDYMTERYGEFVRYRPAVAGRTWLLWFGPFALLLAGLGGLILRLRQQARSKLPQPPDLSAADRRRLDVLLGTRIAEQRR